MRTVHCMFLSLSLCVCLLLLCLSPPSSLFYLSDCACVRMHGSCVSGFAEGERVDSAWIGQKGGCSSFFYVWAQGKRKEEMIDVDGSTTTTNSHSSAFPPTLSAIIVDYHYAPQSFPLPWISHDQSWEPCLCMSPLVSTCLCHSNGSTYPCPNKKVGFGRRRYGCCRLLNMEKKTRVLRCCVSVCVSVQVCVCLGSVSRPNTIFIDHTTLSGFANIRCCGFFLFLLLLILLFVLFLLLPCSSTPYLRYLILPLRTLVITGSFSLSIDKVPLITVIPLRAIINTFSHQHFPLCSYFFVAVGIAFYR